jgi:hypothetical protein
LKNSSSSRLLSVTHAFRSAICVLGHT